jgi:hypothetical protein
MNEVLAQAIGYGWKPLDVCISSTNRRIPTMLLQLNTEISKRSVPWYHPSGKEMQMCMFERAHQNVQSKPVIVLITGDRDYLVAIQGALRSGFEVMILYRKVTHPSLVDICTWGVKWSVVKRIHTLSTKERNASVPVPLHYIRFIAYKLLQERGPFPISISDPYVRDSLLCASSYGYVDFRIYFGIWIRWVGLYKTEMQRHVCFAVFARCAWYAATSRIVLHIEKYILP